MFLGYFLYDFCSPISWVSFIFDYIKTKSYKTQGGNIPRVFLGSKKKWHLSGRQTCSAAAETCAHGGATSIGGRGAEWIGQ